MNALHEQFVAEARELIQQATDDLIALEREGFAIERIDRIFRAFHTLKGSAGVVELPAMSLTLHAAEDLLAAIHGGQMTATSDIIDQALACLDQVSRWVNDFEAEGSLPSHAGEDARSMAEQLRDLLSASSRKKPATIGGALRNCRERPAVGMGRRVDRISAREGFRMGAGPSDRTLRGFLRTACRLLLRRCRPASVDAASPESLGISHRRARSPGRSSQSSIPFACNLRLQCIAAGKSRRARTHLPPGTGSGAHRRYPFGAVATEATYARRSRHD